MQPQALNFFCFAEGQFLLNNLKKKFRILSAFQSVVETAAAHALFVKRLWFSELVSR